MAISVVAVVEGSATNGGNVTLTLPSSLMLLRDVVIISGGVPQTAIDIGVQSSFNYTELIDQNSTGSYRFSVSRKVMYPSLDTQAVCVGTGASSDGVSYVGIIFRGVVSTSPEDTTTTSTTGSGTTPDSPSITTVSSGVMLVSCVGSNVSDTTVTAPSSYTNQVDVNASDTRSSTVGMACVIVSSAQIFNPTSWTNFTSGVWCAVSVALRPDTFIWSQMQQPEQMPTGMNTEMTGY